MAMLFLVLSQSTTHSVSTYYTFGQPRVGNEAFANVFKTLVSEYRVVHYADIVPHLPPEVLGFHHVATEVSLAVDFNQRFPHPSAHAMIW